jgi:hypothetical protein
MLFKNSVRTTKRTPHFTITKINWLTLFKEVIAVYNKKHTKPINTKRRVTDYYSRWDIYLPLSFKRVRELYMHCKVHDGLCGLFTLLLKGVRIKELRTNTWRGRWRMVNCGWLAGRALVSLGISSRILSESHVWQWRSASHIWVHRLPTVSHILC